VNTGLTSDSFYISFHPAIETQAPGDGSSTSSRLVFPLRKKSNSFLSIYPSPSRTFIVI